MNSKLEISLSLSMSQLKNSDPDEFDLLPFYSFDDILASCDLCECQKLIIKNFLF
jgi:hypothetical protein